MPGPQDSYLEEKQRQVERSAELSLKVKDVFKSSNDAGRVVDGLGGVVLSSSVSDNHDGAYATLTLAVPAHRLDEAVRQLARLGQVQNRTQQAVDVTAVFKANAEQVKVLRAERRSLLRELAATTSRGQRERVKQELADNLRGLNALAQEAKLSAQRTRSSQITLQLSSGEAAEVVRQHDGSLDVGEALDLAGRWLSSLAALLLLATLVLLPLALMAGLGWRVWRRYRRD